MVDSPREVIGAVLKHLGSSYNTVDMETDVSGGKEAVLKSFTQLQKQVCPKYARPFWLFLVCRWSIWQVTIQNSELLFVTLDWFWLPVDRSNYSTAWTIWSHLVLEMYGLQWDGAVMWSLLQNECLMSPWLFPSQAAAYGLIYGYVMFFSSIINTSMWSCWTSILLIVMVLCIVGNTMRFKVSGRPNRQQNQRSISPHPPMVRLLPAEREKPTLPARRHPRSIATTPREPSSRGPSR